MIQSVTVAESASFSRTRRNAYAFRYPQRKSELGKQRSQKNESNHHHCLALCSLCRSSVPFAFPSAAARRYLFPPVVHNLNREHLARSFMPLTHIVEGDSVLTYALQTEPTPVQVSPASGPPSIATLRFVMTAPKASSSIVVSKVVFRLPIGDPAAPAAIDLTQTAAGISASVSSSGPERWSIGPGAEPGVFLLEPADNPPVPITTQGIVVELTGIQVSPIVGTAQVKIVEFTDGGGTQPRRFAITVPKFPLGFSAGNFSAEAPMVENGATAVLTWNGSTQAFYTMLWGSQSRTVSDIRRWTSPPLTDDTTFILQVSAQQSGETVVLHFSVTVIVAHPSLLAKDLTVQTTSKLQGAVTAETTLDVKGQSTLASLSVTGTAHVANLVSSALTANGLSTILNLTVTKQLTATGHVSLFQQIQMLSRGQYVAYTDGLVLGYINTTDVLTKKCWGTIRGSSTLGGAMAAGGASLVWMIGNEAQAMGTPGSFLLPVQKDRTFWVWNETRAGSEVAPGVWFTWIPFGNPNPDQPTVKKLSDNLPPQ